MAIKSLTTDLILNANPFKAGLKDAEGAASSFGSNLAGKFGGALGPLTALTAAATASAAAFVVVGKAVADLGAKAEKIQNLSKQTGFAAESVQQLSRIAENAGGSFEQVATGMKFLQKNIAAANPEFAKLGLNLQELAALSPEEQFQRTAAAIAAIDNPAQRTAAALHVFGRSGTELIPILDQLAKGSSSFATTLSGEQLNALADLDDELDRVKGSWQDLKDQLVASIGTNDSIVEGIKAVADVLAGLAGVVKDNQEVFAFLFRGLAAMATGGLSEAAITLGKVMKAKREADFMDYKPVKGPAKGAGAGPAPLVTDLTAVGIDLGEPSEEMKAAADRFKDSFKESEKAAKEFQDSVDRISGKKAQRELDDLGKAATAAMRSGGIADPDTFRSDVERLVKAGATAIPPSIQRVLAANPPKLPPFDLGAALDSLGPIEEMPKELSAAFAQTGIEGARSFASIAAAAQKAGLNTVEIQDALKSAGASSDQVKDAIGSLGVELTNVQDITFDWQTALQGVALLAGSLGGIFGDVLQIVGNIGQQFKGWKDMKPGEKFGAIAGSVGQLGGLIGQKYKKTGGALQGAAGGAMTGFALGGPIGAAIGGIAGGIMGFLGGKKKEKEEKAKREAEFKALTSELEAQYGSLSRLEEVAGKYGVSLKKALASKDAEKLNKELAELQKRQEGLRSAGQGIVALVQAFKPATEAGAMAQAGLFSSVFWATVQREGLMAAAESMKPAFDTLMEGASESMKALLAPIGQQMSLAANEAFKGAAAGAQALGQTIKGMMDAGIVSINDLKNAGVVAMEQYNAALAAAQAEGLTGIQAQEAAVRAIGPAITELLKGYDSLGIPLDDNAMALKAAADATGMMFPQDKMERAADAMERVAGALEKAFGLSTGIADQLGRAASVRFPEMPSYGGGGGGAADVAGGGGGPWTEALPPDLGDFGGGRYAEFQGGGYGDFGSGTPAMLHGREAIIPMDRLSELSGGGQGVSVSMPVTINVDGSVSPEETVNSIVRALQMQQGRLADEIRRAVGLD